MSPLHLTCDINNVWNGNELNLIMLVITICLLQAPLCPACVAAWSLLVLGSFFRECCCRGCRSPSKQASKVNSIATKEDEINFG